MLIFERKCLLLLITPLVCTFASFLLFFQFLRSGITFHRVSVHARHLQNGCVCVCVCWGGAVRQIESVSEANPLHPEITGPIGSSTMCKYTHL